MFSKQLASVDENNKTGNACSNSSFSKSVTYIDQIDISSTYKPPRRNIPNTPSFCLVDICRFHIKGKGMIKIMRSIRTSETHEARKFAV